MKTINEALLAIKNRPTIASSREDKKNFAERFSRNVALCLANALRRQFPGVLPNEDGTKHESKARGVKGFKKLDVNYSTAELGLGLGVSVKTINFADPRTKRYTKNYTRVDNELRAEAMDYHVRQPYSVLVAVVLLPTASCDDARREPSSFFKAVDAFRRRAGRIDPDKQSAEQFERVFVGLYETEGDNTDETRFFDVMTSVPRAGRPALDAGLSLKSLVEQITTVFQERNSGGSRRPPPSPIDERSRRRRAALRSFGRRRDRN